MSEYMRVMRGLLGKRVRVSADHAVVAGVLRGFDEYGEIDVVDDDGHLHHAGPGLRIVEVVV